MTSPYNVVFSEGNWKEESSIGLYADETDKGTQKFWKSKQLEEKAWSNKVSSPLCSSSYH